MDSEDNGPPFSDPGSNQGLKSSSQPVDPEAERSQHDPPQEPPMSTGILPQSMPFEEFDSAERLLPSQSLRYEPIDSVYGSSPKYGLGQTGNRYQARTYPSPSSSFLPQDPPVSKGMASEGQHTTNILPSNPSPFSSGVAGTAFSVLPPVESSSQMPIMPPHQGATQYSPSPVFGYGSSSPGYSGISMGTGYHEMPSHPPHPYLYSSMGPPQPQPSPYDTSTSSSSAYALGGSQSAYAAARLSADSYGRMGAPMYSSSMQSPYAYGPSYPHQYERPRSGGYGSSRGRGTYRGMAREGRVNSPGPPISNPGSGKGPEGANLFVFHIPNEFTNQDMYQLFSEYGNVLSVRIMVESDTGRSRGFGFVSFDSTESAALAIKHLNGYPIKGKRLKVQHKQIKGQSYGHEQSRYGHVSPHQTSEHYAQSDTAQYVDSMVSQEMSHYLGQGIRDSPSSHESTPLEPPQESTGGNVASTDHEQIDPRTDDLSQSPLGDLTGIGKALPDP